MEDNVTEEMLARPIWLVGHSYPGDWIDDLKEPLDPRHPNRHNVWTSVLDCLQEPVYANGNRLRLDMGKCLVANAAAKKSHGTHTCPHCSAVYEVTIRHLPAREQDDACRDVCGEVMAEWDDTVVPVFTLIQKPEHPPSDKDNPEQAFDALHREAQDAIGADTWRPRAHHPRSQYRNPRFLRTAARRSETEAPGDRDGGGQMIYDARSVGCLC